MTCAVLVSGMLASCGSKEALPPTPSQGPAPAVPAAALVPKREPPKPVGLLDLEIEQLVDIGGYRVLTPRFVIDFDGKPTFAPRDLPMARTKEIVKGAHVSYETDRVVINVVYMPIPKSIAYDDKAGVTLAIDELLAHYEPGSKILREPSTLGPLKAIHGVADGSLASAPGRPFHFEAWAAWDTEGRALYLLQAATSDPAAAEIQALHASFKPREK